MLFKQDESMGTLYLDINAEDGNVMVVLDKLEGAPLGESDGPSRRYKPVFKTYRGSTSSMVKKSLRNFRDRVALEDCGFVGFSESPLNSAFVKLRKSPGEILKSPPRRKAASDLAA